MKSSTKTFLNVCHDFIFILGLALIGAILVEFYEHRNDDKIVPHICEKCKDCPRK